jgi:hypothetical protein
VCLASGRLHEAVKRRADVGEGVREEVAIGVQGDVDRSVAELGLEELRVRARRDRERSVGVAEVVEPGAA